jgi:hypothetical protein
LHGIGGRTIQEAKSNISYAEAVTWKHYIDRRGSLNLGRRLEAGVALLAFQQNRINGGKAKLEDFMPHEKEETTSDGSINDLARLLKAKPTKARKRFTPRKK